MEQVFDKADQLEHFPRMGRMVPEIEDEARYLEEASQEVGWEEFAEDETLKRAFVRSIEVIGEAAKNLSTEIRKRHSDVEWRAMAGIRDRLIHGYFV